MATEYTLEQLHLVPEYVQYLKDFAKQRVVKFFAFPLKFAAWLEEAEAEDAREGRAYDNHVRACSSMHRYI